MERLAYRPPQLSMESYARSAREGEHRAQVWRHFRLSMLVAARGFILVRDGVLRSDDP
jgi:hypothetical protein